MAQYMCKERHDIKESHRDYPSKSDPDKSYRAYAFREAGGELPMCTCMPFLTGRKKKAKEMGVSVHETFFICSHLKDLYNTVCQWVGDKPARDGSCPSCGGEVVFTDNPGLNAQELVDDLQGLRTELAGEPHPGQPKLELVPDNVSALPSPAEKWHSALRGRPTFELHEQDDGWTAEISINGHVVCGLLGDGEVTDPTLVVWDEDGEAVITLSIPELLGNVTDLQGQSAADVAKTLMSMVGGK